MEPDRPTIAVDPPRHDVDPTLPHPASSQGRAPGWTLSGRYRIEEVIGSGGMSTVYRATDTVLARDVAVKVLLAFLADGDPTLVARFEREARAVAALHHPAVVKIYDTGLDRGSHFIVMEYVAGRGLDEILREGTPLDPHEATRIAARVAEALAAAHAAGILHRDIKPANVMVAPPDVVKVLDFGIARARSEATLTQGALALGTAAYMPPERILGRPGDERSDIYGLGCLLYAMLTGRPPFVAPDTVAVLHQQVHDEPTPPSALGAPIAPPLESLILRMLAKDPAERPSPAAEIAARLGEGTPRATPLSRAAPISRTAPTIPAAPVAMTVHRRRPWALGLAAALAILVLVLILAGSGGSGLRTTGLKRAKPAPARATITHRAPHTAVTHPAVTQPSPPTETSQAPVTQPAPTTPAAPPATKHEPPGHGGVPPGQAKKHHEKPPKPPKHEGKPPK
ncbi:MAG: protein kinase domain-containing protein [Solirubrobacteraceae bacterium]